MHESNVELHDAWIKWDDKAWHIDNKGDTSRDLYIDVFQVTADWEIGLEAQPRIHATRSYDGAPVVLSADMERELEETLHYEAIRIIDREHHDSLENAELNSGRAFASGLRHRINNSRDSLGMAPL